MPPQAPKAASTKSMSELATEAAAADKPITLELTTEVTLGGTTWTKLEFQPLRARHLRDLPGDPSRITVGSLLDIAETMAAVPTGVIDELAPEDCRAVTDIVNAFLLRIQGTGG